MKALAMLIFFGAAVCVQGGFYLDVSVPPEGLRAGDTVEIRMVGEIGPGVLLPIEGFVLIWGPGAIHGGRIVYPGGGEYQDAPDGIFDPQMMPDDYAMWRLGTVWPTVQPPYSGVLIDQILFTCGGAGAVTVELLDGLSFEVIDSIQILQVPEPCMLGLLGLGASGVLRGKHRKPIYTM